MARTEVDARRELHNGTNNAGEPQGELGFRDLSRERYYVKLNLPHFRLDSRRRSGKETVIGRQDRWRTCTLDGPWSTLEGGVAVISGRSGFATST